MEIHGGLGYIRSVNSRAYPSAGANGPDGIGRRTERPPCISMALLRK
jgi:hypothetical protein